MSGRWSAQVVEVSGNAVTVRALDAMRYFYRNLQDSLETAKVGPSNHTRRPRRPSDGLCMLAVRSSVRTSRLLLSTTCMSLSALQTAAANAPPLRILAFGDSLTAGWTSFGSGPTSPYAPHLEKALKKHHGIKATVEAIGQAGLPASQALRPLKGALANRFDAVLILMGANDVLGGGGITQHGVDTMLTHLRSLHSECRRSGAKCVALGFPDHPAIADKDGGAALLANLNARIGAEAHADAFIDTHGFLGQKSLWSSDQIHMTDGGYAVFGAALAAPLAAVLRPSAPGGGSSSSGDKEEELSMF